MLPDSKEHRIYVQFAPALLRFASSYTADYAEDVVHDVFLRFWQSPQLDLPDEELRKLLFASVRNACIDHLRRLQRQTFLVDPEVLALMSDELAFAEDLEDWYMRKDLTDCIMQKAEALPDKMREVFMKAYAEGMKSPEIAEELGLSQRTVENQLYKALQTLKKWVKGG